MVNQVNHNLPLSANEVKQNCKGLSCEFFGCEEFGGYCSGCFMNITKKEAAKQGNLYLCLSVCLSVCLCGGGGKGSIQMNSWL